MAKTPIKTALEYSRSYLPVRRAFAVAHAYEEDAEPPRKPPKVWEPRNSRSGLGLRGLNGFALKILLPQVLKRVEQAIKRSRERSMRTQPASCGQIAGWMVLRLHAG